mmetsp:Transcript_3497/g.9842  ORF Transcript_3497/g.9842 Transcript_3497/m.9842 type:complete len:256 (+) Transcript_3497:3243-4010(+)
MKDLRQLRQKVGLPDLHGEPLPVARVEVHEHFGDGLKVPHLELGHLDPLKVFRLAQLAHLTEPDPLLVHPAPLHGNFIDHPGQTLLLLLHRRAALFPPQPARLEPQHLSLVRLKLLPDVLAPLLVLKAYRDVVAHLRVRPCDDGPVALPLVRVRGQDPRQHQRRPRIRLAHNNDAPRPVRQVLLQDDVTHPVVFPRPVLREAVNLHSALRLLHLSNSLSLSLCARARDGGLSGTPLRLVPFALVFKSTHASSSLW